MGNFDTERNPVEVLAEEFADRHRRGEEPNLEEFAGRHPELADDIRELFPALVVMEQLKPAETELTGPCGLAEPPDGAASHIGDYRIVREVGRGGMGVVYEAVQESLGRHVALKVLPAQGLAGASYLERFRREARAAGRLHHTNIVPVYGTGEAGGVHYYAMQFINGQGLDAVLDELRRQRGAARPADVTARQGSTVDRAPAAATEQVAGHELAKSLAGQSGLGGTADHFHRAVARLGLQAAEALAYAHRQGVLHRDVKPSNLLLDLQGTVWITDFGLAKADDGVDLTHTGDVVGTLRYMAPERFEGQSLPQGDVYSLGLTLYELLTLRPAFDDPNRARLVEKVLHEQPPPPSRVDPTVPRDLETIVLKCLARDPAARYAHAADLAEDLRRFMTDRSILARRSPWHERARRWCRRNPAVALLSASVALLLVAISVGSLLLAAHLANQRDQIKKQRDVAIENANRAVKAEERARAYLEMLELLRTVQPDPGNLASFQHKVGQTYHFEVTGAPGGHLWGSDVYTLDSALPTAAVHAGLLEPGNKGVVKVTILEGRSAYAGSKRNGVLSSPWGQYGFSYKVEREPRFDKLLSDPLLKRPGATELRRAASVADLQLAARNMAFSSSAPAYVDSVVGYRAVVGKSVTMTVTGATEGPLWGTDVYTDDSSVAVAAVHAGLLKPGQKGTVRVTILKGQPAYEGTLRNGIQSSPYAEWQGSFRLELAEPER